MQFILAIPHIASPDLLRIAVESIPSIWGSTFVIDNSGSLRPADWPCEIYAPPVAFSLSQSMNLLFHRAERAGCDAALYMHSDGRSVDGAHDTLLEIAARRMAEDPTIGLFFSNYDTLALYSMKAVRATGGYDPLLPNYGNDCDFHYRMRLRGFKTVESGVQVEHLGSSTLKRVPYVSGILAAANPLFSDYYIRKWGGPPGQERFIFPFNDPALVDQPLEERIYG